jgi:ParB-like chromosome segregation protein Spo0J
MDDGLYNSEPKTPAGKSYLQRSQQAFQGLGDLPNRERLRVVNAIRLELHQISPLSSEPVDCVLWVPSKMVEANDYNPNVVAPPEMKLLERSIIEDGYTQPVVTWIENNGRLRREVIDGFHRREVGVKSPDVRSRSHGYLPVTTVNGERTDRGDRIASTIRHNRARGKHQVEAMSDIVVELKRRNWSDARIGKELGMEPDEVLRLCQITGLAEVFKDVEFSKAWDIGSFAESLDEAGLAEIEEL